MLTTRRVDGMEFILKEHAFSYALIKEIEAVTGTKLTEEEFADLMESKLYMLSDCLSEMLAEWTEEKDENQEEWLSDEN